MHSSSSVALASLQPSEEGGQGEESVVGTRDTSETGAAVGKDARRCSGRGEDHDMVAGDITPGMDKERCVTILWLGGKLMNC